MARSKDRGEGQTAITFSLDERLAAAIDARRDKLRSVWIREACAEKLARTGYEVPTEWVQTPDRAGKGGRPRKQRSAYDVPEKKGLRAAEEPGEGEENDETPR